MPVDKFGFEHAVKEGASALGLSVSTEALAGMSKMADELLRWNAKVNLTAIVAPEEVAEKHFVDSLAVLPEVELCSSLLDLGAGAGFPGIPLALARSEFRVTLADAVAKKVGFMKHVIAASGLAGRVRAEHVRAEGNAAKEGLPQVDAVVSRALMDLEPWLQLAKDYVLPGGRVVAMMGQTPGADRARLAAQSAGLEFVSLREYMLPFSKVSRAVVCAIKQAT